MRASSQTTAKEIDALLKRLHSGCRFILLEEEVNNNRTNKHDFSNTLRNATQPDEVHSDLGRALAHSYLDSLLLNDDNDLLGERIILALCCGEDIGSNNSGNNGNKIGDIFLDLIPTLKKEN